MKLTHSILTALILFAVFMALAFIYGLSTQDAALASYSIKLVGITLTALIPTALYHLGGEPCQTN